MTKLTPRGSGSVLCVVLFSGFLTTACGSDSGDSPAGLRGLTVEPMGEPVIQTDGDGRTKIISSFVARAQDPGGLRALTVNETVTEFLLDGAVVSGESVLSRDELGGDLLYSLVLDASYSMVVDHQPPAFAPMLAAARASMEEVAREWQTRGTTAEVRFDWLWFDDYINYPDEKAVGNISLIPAPTSGENDTRLFGAVDFMMKRHIEAAANGFAVEAQDRHVMVLFTDGNDNRSYFVTSEINERLNTPFAHLRHRPGAPTNGHTDLIQRFEAAKSAGQLPNFTLHAIALGTNLRTEPLAELAASQGGTVVQNPSSGNLTELFETITREVVSIQTVGLKLPLRPGTYELTVRVRSRDQPGMMAEYPVTFQAQ